LVSHQQVFTSELNGVVAEIDFAGEAGNFNADNPYPDGTVDSSLDNIALLARADVTIPVGDWTIGFGSADGGYLRLDDVEFTSRTNSDVLSPANEIRFDGRRDLGWTYGSFRVETEPLETTLEALYFASQDDNDPIEDDLWEIAIRTGESSLPFGGQLLKDGEGGWQVTSLSHPATLTDISGQMANVNSSAYIRIPFEVADVSEFDSLSFKTQYTDGFVAYLNGQRVASSAGAPISPAWNSSEPNSRTYQDASQFEYFDLTNEIGLLQNGSNLLAIHGLSESPLDDTFFVLPELFAGGNFLAVSPTILPKQTPGYLHNSDRLDALGEVSVDQSSGYYDAGFNVALSASDPSVVIHFTTDGTTPTVLDQVYTSPISVTTTTVLRAIGLRPGFPATNVTTRSYIFLDDVLNQDGAGYPTEWDPEPGNDANYVLDPTVVADNIATIKDDIKSLRAVSLVFDPDALFDEDVGLYLNPDATGRQWERAVAIEMLDTSGDSVFSIDAGIRIHGNSSRSNAFGKKSFRLFFRSDYGESKLNYPLFGPDAADSFDRLVLRAGPLDGWSTDAISFPNLGGGEATYLRERWISDVQNAMNSPAHNGEFVQLFLNGMYWGMYHLHERVDEEFGESYFGGNSNDYVALNAGPITPGDYDAWDELMSVVNSPSNYNAVQAILDVPAFIDYILVNDFGANVDWGEFSNNWTATYNDSNSLIAKWYFHSWDADTTLADETRSFLIPGPADTSFGPVQIFQVLADNYSEFRSDIVDRIQEHFFNGGALSDQINSLRWDGLADSIDAAIVAESARWGDGRYPQSERQPGGPFPSFVTRTRDDWQQEVDRVRDDFLAVDALRRNGASQVWTALYGFFNQIEFTVDAVPQHGGQVSIGDTVRISKDIGDPLLDFVNDVIYLTIDGSDPRMPDGSISPNAIAYNDLVGIPILDTTYVRARTFGGLSGTEWSASVEATFTTNAEAGVGDIAITELMYNPADPTSAELAIDPSFTDNSFEYIELRNVSEATVDLVGLEFTQGTRFRFSARELLGNADGSQRLTNPLTLAPGEFIVVVADRNAFEARYADEIEAQSIRIAGEFDYYHVLSNSSERLRLIDANRAEIHDFQYQDTSPWPVSADGQGPALSVVNVNGDYSSPSNWVATQANGSPGYSEFAGPKVQSVEILSSGDGAHVYSIPDGPDQLLTVQVGGADMIRIGFSEQLDPSSVSASDLVLVSIQENTNVLSPTSVSIDAGNQFVTWTFQNAFVADFFMIVVPSHAIESTNGFFLDGEWLNPQSINSTSSQISSFPSGNGKEGGDFEFLFTILPGDFIGPNGVIDNVVGGPDFTRLAFNFGNITVGATFVDGDADGDGAVGGGDFTLLALNFGTNLDGDVIMSTDSNDDGVVNYLDLAVFLANFGATGASSEDGDANGDGVVDLLDLDLFFALWGIAFNAE